MQFIFFHIVFSSKLQTDLKTTNTEEMKIAMETYYEEVENFFFFFWFLGSGKNIKK